MDVEAIEIINGKTYTHTHNSTYWTTAALLLQHKCQLEWLLMASGKCGKVVSG